jgi:glycosyltransferase involved in cell wall biosynthesis
VDLHHALRHNRLKRRLNRIGAERVGDVEAWDVALTSLLKLSLGRQKMVRVLIVAEHASARFGGEAALPLHYYRVLRKRGYQVWLLCHARVRQELSELYPDDIDDRIRIIEDSAWHRALWRVDEVLPARIGYLTTGFLSRLSTQLQQRNLARQLVIDLAIDVVHQPMPVSPKEPSILYDLGAPVVIGPMNGAMEYPPAFQRQAGIAQRLAIRAGRAIAGSLNKVMPGKPRAACLIAANARTAANLPSRKGQLVHILVENGVDLSLWTQLVTARAGDREECAHFVFMGRLVDWKAVDILVDAFCIARQAAAMSLTIIGDGPERPRLEAACALAGLPLGPIWGTTGRVHFTGWKAQSDAASLLREHDVLVLPSLLECGGAVVLEAMSTGLAVIATDWGGPADYLDERCGILVPPTSRESMVLGLSSTMSMLARDPDLCRAMGLAGRMKVIREFDWEAKVDRVVSIYHEAIAAERA